MVDRVSRREDGSNRGSLRPEGLTMLDVVLVMVRLSFVYSRLKSLIVCDEAWNPSRVVTVPMGEQDVRDCNLSLPEKASYPIDPTFRALRMVSHGSASTPLYSPRRCR